MLWAIKIILQENYDLKNREVTRQKKTPPAIVCHELVDWFLIPLWNDIFGQKPNKLFELERYYNINSK